MTKYKELKQVYLEYPENFEEEKKEKDKPKLTLEELKKRLDPSKTLHE